MFLTARLFMYQQVYFHRTVRAIDLDLAEVFGPSVRAIFGDGSPADALAAYADLDEYAPAPPGGPLGARRGASRQRRRRATATVTPDVADAWRAILLRRPRWRAEAEIRAEYEAGAAAGRRDRRPWAPRSRAGSRSTSRSSTPGRPTPTATDSLLAVEGRDGLVAVARPLARALPAYALIARRYRRATRRRSAGWDLAGGRGRCGVAALIALAIERRAAGRRRRRGRTSSGSIRAISCVGSFIRFTTSGSTPNVFVSSGLNSP